MQPVEIAMAVEDHGFDSLFFPEHTHIPAGRMTPYPRGGDLPEKYYRCHDPFVALAACAAVTNRIRLCTGICLVAERDPIVLAKEIASLDVISNGRVVLGVGGGWNREEAENHGVDFKNRWKVLREKVLAMKAIWSNDDAEFHGEYVDFNPIWSWPKPLQIGGPPVWIGANSKWVYDRVAEYGDGWMPSSGLQPDSVKNLTDALEARDRKIEDIDITLYFAPPDAKQINTYMHQGFGGFVFQVESDSVGQTLSQLEQLARVVKTVNG